ncbi:MAG: VOC family protein [Sphingomonadales bacterium]
MQMFVNLPVGDLPRSVAFFRALGFDFDDKFTDETAACMKVRDDQLVMLLTREKFSQFTARPVADATQATEVLVAVALDNRGDVDVMVDKALAAGGTKGAWADDYGFMYGRSFSDPDGHIWEMFWMDPKFEGGCDGGN